MDNRLTKFLKTTKSFTHYLVIPGYIVFTDDRLSDARLKHGGVVISADVSRIKNEKGDVKAGICVLFKILREGLKF